MSACQGYADLSLAAEGYYVLLPARTGERHVTIPSMEKPIIQFQIRPLLSERVTLYTSSTEMRHRIVEKTIRKATSDPSILLDDLIDEALYRLMHETAVQEMNINRDKFQSSPIGHQLWRKEDNRGK